MRKLGLLTATLAALLTAMLSTHGATLAAVGGPVCNVPTDYPTIQAAVNAGGCSTIVVAPGVYVENVTINRPLTLKGAKHGVDARGRGVANESIIDGGAGTILTVNASNVTVDGFTLRLGGATFAIPAGHSNELLENNAIQNPQHVAFFTTSQTTFRQNAIHATAATLDGIEENSGPANDITVADNSFDGIASGGYTADVTIISGFPGVPPVSNRITIKGNKSSTGGTFVAVFNSTTVHITGNISTGSTNGTAIYIGGNDTNVTVSDNHVSGDTASAVKVANAFGDGPNSNITITNNRLNGNGYGVNVDVKSVSAGQTVQVHQNNIVGNTIFGVVNTSSGAVNARCNWWGKASGPGPVGPGTGDRVSTAVKFAPWLTAPAPQGDCDGGTESSGGDGCFRGDCNQDQNGDNGGDNQNINIGN